MDAVWCAHKYNHPKQIWEHEGDLSTGQIYRISVWTPLAYLWLEEDFWTITAHVLGMLVHSASSHLQKGLDKDKNTVAF